MNLFKQGKKNFIWVYALVVGGIWIMVWALDWGEVPALDPDFLAEDLPVFAPPSVSSAPKKYFTLEPLD